MTGSVRLPKQPDYISDRHSKSGIALTLGQTHRLANTLVFRPTIEYSIEQLRRLPQGAEWNSEEEYYYITFEGKNYRLIFDQETNKWTVPRRSTRVTAPSPAARIARRFSAQETELEKEPKEEPENSNTDRNSNPDTNMSGTMTVTSQTTTQPQQGGSGGGSGGGAPPPPPPNPPAGGGPNLPGGGRPNPPGGPGGFAGVAAAPAAHPMGEIGINRPQPFDGNVDD